MPRMEKNNATVINLSQVIKTHFSITSAPGFRPGFKSPVIGYREEETVNTAKTRKKVAGLVYNATELLDKLLMGYDSRLRPDFGGELYDHYETWGCCLALIHMFR